MVEFRWTREGTLDADVIYKFKANEAIALFYSVIIPSPPNQQPADTVNHQLYPGHLSMVNLSEETWVQRDQGLRGAQGESIRGHRVKMVQRDNKENQE